MLCTPCNMDTAGKILPLSFGRIHHPLCPLLKGDRSLEDYTNHIQMKSDESSELHDER
jgi:hypothetical protein